MANNNKDAIFISNDAKYFLVKFSLLLIIGPMVTLFVIRDFLGPHLEIKRNFTEALSIIGAVIVLQLVLVWSCVAAFKPESDEIAQTPLTNEETKKDN
jgi:hypothetical protein